MSRIDRTNKQLGIELSNIISREFSNWRDSDKYMITITYVACDRDLTEAKVGISVLPKKYTGTALRQLKKNTQIIVEQINKNVKIRKLPHFHWEVDKTERQALELEETLDYIQNQKQEKEETEETGETKETKE